MEDLARLSFKSKPVYIAVDEGKHVATREGLEQVGLLVVVWGTGGGRGGAGKGRRDGLQFFGA